MVADTFVPELILAQIRNRTGIALDLIAVAPPTTSAGAAYVRWPDGRDGVLTCPPVPATVMAVTAEVLEVAKAAGAPVPRHELVIPLSDNQTAVVQERLPGKQIWRVDEHLIDAMIEVNDRFAGLLADRPDVLNPSLCLRREPTNDWRHQPLEDYNARTRTILRWIQEIGDQVPDRIPGGDLLHVDYARGNVLADDHGRITGVVDWNLGVARGDRHYALVSLRSDLEWNALPRNGIDDAHRAAMQRLDRVLDERIDPATLRAYWASWTLTKLNGLIRQNTPDALDVFLDLGYRRLT